MVNTELAERLGASGLGGDAVVNRDKNAFQDGAGRSVFVSAFVHINRRICTLSRVFIPRVVRVQRLPTPYEHFRFVDVLFRLEWS
jgi:hypothetical protein